MKKSVIAGKLIQKSEVETLRKDYPNASAKDIGSMLGVSVDVVHQLYNQYGWGKAKRKSSTYPYLAEKRCSHSSVTANQITSLLKDFPNLTLEKLANKLETSVGQVEKTMRENNLKIGHKGRKIPMTEEELEDEIEYLVKYTGMLRQEIAAELNVTPPTIGNYVKRLKEQGRIDKNFSFRGRAAVASEQINR